MARRVTAIVQPDVARDHRREVAAGAFAPRGADSEFPSHVLVEDNGAEATVFSFASNALLFAGQPAFELRGYLGTLGARVNRVYLRDIHRTAYHLDPRGNPGGAAFYEDEVRRLMAELGSRVNIGIGDSSGGSAALYFGTRCTMDKVIAFSPPFPIRYWTEPRARLRALCDWRLLQESRYSYWEVVSMGTMASLFATDLRKLVGDGATWDPLAEFRAAAKHPEAVVFYGARCGPDAKIAELWAAMPGVRTVPIDTGRHNVTTELGRKGLLRDYIANEVREAIESRGVTGPAAPAETPDIAP